MIFQKSSVYHQFIHHATAFIIFLNCRRRHRHHHHHHHHYHHHHPLADMVWGHLLTRSDLTHLEVFLMVTPGFFCLLVYSFFILVFPVIYFGESCLYVATNAFCMPVFSQKTGVIFSSFAISVFVV
jgi:hypothetical protein